jgi:hypothetical protein
MAGWAVPHAQAGLKLQLEGELQGSGSADLIEAAEASVGTAAT